MTSIHIYLTFNGNCEEAFTYYSKVFESELGYMGRFSEMPPDPKFPIPEDQLNRVMHTSLNIGKSVLMGSDTGGEWGAKFKQGNNFSVSVAAESKAEADRIFSELSEGGHVIMPISDTFWESYFGNLVDKFGIGWMVSYTDPEKMQKRT